MAIDLFSGAGGLSEGLKAAGFRVSAAVENDRLAVESYRVNHPQTRIYDEDIAALEPRDVMEDLGVVPGELALLAGCPPCQGFSSMRTRNGKFQIDDANNDLVFEFLRFAEAFLPQALMMENVPGLQTDARMVLLANRLEALGYRLNAGVLDTSNYEVPQRRRRFILLGLRGVEPAFGKPSSRRVTVRTAIGQLPEPARSQDPLHSVTEKRSERLRNLIADIPKDGGSRMDLGSDRQLECHREHRGHYDVYGRMSWDSAAPTITGGCINPSRGRFLHPEQNRAITPREAALLQSFPADYFFSMRRGKYAAAQLVGNALPPRFIELQARALRQQLSALSAQS